MRLGRSLYSLKMLKSGGPHHPMLGCECYHSTLFSVDVLNRVFYPEAPICTRQERAGGIPKQDPYQA